MDLNVNLLVKKYKTEGDIAWEYNPLRNLKDEDGEIKDFQVSNDTMGISLDKPVDIECQQSYDGTVNLILNDDSSPPRIINSRFTMLENNRYKVINRNQIKQSNIYNEKTIDNETRLFRNVQKIPKLTLNKISYFGQLMGGNYTFYMKYADDDYNQTDIVAETGIISVFHGTTSDPKSCSGAFMDERTDKSIIMILNNIDTSFTYFNLYFTRSTCDDTGTVIQKAYKILHNYEISDESQLISINGYEELSEISIEELNIQYNIVTRVKSQAQVQNRLFFANIDKPEDKNAELRNLSLHIIAKEKQEEESIGFIDPLTFSSRDINSISQCEYYSPYNLYYKLGYFPGEIYRFGIVYIFNDDHLSPTYNLRGVDFNQIEIKNGELKQNYQYNGKIDTIEYKDFLYEQGALTNTAGVFRFTKATVTDDSQPINQIIDYKNKTVRPLGIQFEIPDKVIEQLKTFNIKGYFFVRQKRIPIFLAQGFSVGVDSESYVPMLRDGKDSDGNPSYFTESFINKSKTLVTDYNSRIIKSITKQSSGLICVDACVDKQLQSMFNSSEFNLTLAKKFTDELVTGTKKRLYSPNLDNVEWDKLEGVEMTASDLLFIEEEIPQKIHDDFGFSTKAGMQEELKQVICFGRHVVDDADFTGYVRGVYGSFVGTTSNLEDNCLYSIYVNNFSETFLEEYFTIRLRDRSPFFAITDRYELEEYSEQESGVDPAKLKEIVIYPEPASSLQDYIWLQKLRSTLKHIEEDVNMNDADKNAIEAYLDLTDPQLQQKASEIKQKYFIENVEAYDYEREIQNPDYKVSRLPLTFRGDCFTNTVCQRIQRNFTSSSVPINDQIIEPNCWKENFKGALSTEDWDNISKADVDAVPIGSWLSYKCLSNYHIGIRTVDTFHVDELAIMGNNRSFYPINDISIKSSNKIPETTLYNKGYGSSLGVRRNYAFERVPYIKDVFDTRIMFSNTQVDGAFKNSYKVFQGLAYEDMDRQYGGITKILPWNNNILCVFEHAIAIVPVNEKALIQTTTGQNVHMYGTGVLQKQMSIISDMYGSSWKDSIIRTSRSLYGVDTSAKKIWRLSEEGFNLISDFTVQRFLNDEINLRELEKDVLMGVRNVKTHYNAYKNDVMFTFYNRDKIWNLCYNEIRNNWITRYSWTPLLSENINNAFFSFDLLKTRIFGIINNNLRKKDNSEIVVDSQWNGIWEDISKDKELSLFIQKDYTDFNITAIKIKGYTFDPDESKIIETVLVDQKSNDKHEFAEINTDLVYAKVYNVIKTLGDTGNNNFDIQQAYYNSYETIKDKNSIIVLKGHTSKGVNEYLYYTIEVSYLPYLIASYGGEVINEDTFTSDDVIKNNSLLFASYERSITVGLILPYDSSAPYKDRWNKALLHNIYVHGRSITADEINYYNYIGPNSKVDQILPTKWYDRQEPFEFEIVVNEPRGVHKIFDNLVIISNNVEPNSLEIEIVGDVYNFNKRKNYIRHNFEEHLEDEPEDPPMNKDRLLDVEFDEVSILGNSKEDLDRLRGQNPEAFTYKTDVKWDPILDEYSLIMKQDLRDIKKYGRRIGNIHYTEDSWKVTIQPIYYSPVDSENNQHLSIKSTRVRDKWAKIRVKYSGKRLAIITAIQTAMTQSYA